jgi:MoxR-like ATPase
VNDRGGLIVKNWTIFTGDPSAPHDGIDTLPEPPTWRRFTGEVHAERQLAADDAYGRRRLGPWQRGEAFQASPEEIELVNAALLLRRPLLVTGQPGTGKSSLIQAVARELKLGPVLRWAITSRSTLQQGLYHYDAIGRLRAEHAAGIPKPDGSSQQPVDIGAYIRLGPLGTALLPSRRPRALLIDEIDKSDIDLPNDLLNIFEEGYFEIPELQRIAADEPRVDVRADDGSDKVPVYGGRVDCQAFPFVVLTSNRERVFPPPFLRRCLRLDIDPPDADKLAKIVKAHLGDEASRQAEGLIADFLDRRSQGTLATDQLLNAVYLVTRGIDPKLDKGRLLDVLFKHLDESNL